MKRHDWDEQALNWIGWTRELQDDAYRDYAPAFWNGFVPTGARRALDLGCGEGRSARDLAGRADRTVGVDGSFTLVRAASRVDRRVRYVHGDAARLPFADGSFDLVTAYNVLMDLDDLETSLAEVARVLTSDGTFAACVLHPFAEAGSFEAREPGARFIVDGSYFDEGDYRLTFRRGGHEITFSSRRSTLATYVSAFAAAGFTVATVAEPRPDPRAVERDPSEERWTRLPLFLFVSAVKAPAASSPSSSP